MVIKTNMIEDMKKAVKAGDKQRVSTIRMVLNTIQKLEKDVQRNATEEEVTQAIQTYIKQTKEELNEFEKANRTERIEALSKDIEIASIYLPEPFSVEEIENIVEKEVLKAIAEGNMNIGVVMKAVKPIMLGKADNKVVSEIVRSSINQHRSEI